jgi:hypothetical protein
MGVRENSALKAMVGTKEDHVGTRRKPVSVVVGTVGSEEAYAEGRREDASERCCHLVHIRSVAELRVTMVPRLRT